jgi:hypothetical protein
MSVRGRVAPDVAKIRSTLEAESARMLSGTGERRCRRSIGSGVTEGGSEQKTCAKEL